jgi:hypothetical protein
MKSDYFYLLKIVFDIFDLENSKSEVELKLKDSELEKEFPFPVRFFHQPIDNPRRHISSQLLHRPDLISGQFVFNFLWI